MLIINFSHALNEAQREQIASLCGRGIESVITIPVQIDQHKPVAQQVTDLVDQTGLTAQQWQQEDIVVNPPALSPVGGTLLAELHGRSGHFVPIVHMRRMVDGPGFEVAEVVDLQTVRDQARTRR